MVTPDVATSGAGATRRVVPTVREPVWWGARLAVAPDVRYTEVVGKPVMVVPGECPTVLVAGAEDAVLSTRLDGRPLDEALAGEFAAWDVAERRRVRDVLRRYKALGVLEDADPAGPARPVDWMAPPSRVDRVVVGGALVASDPGPVAASLSDGDPGSRGGHDTRAAALPTLDLTRVIGHRPTATATVTRTAEGRVSIGRIRCSHGPGAPDTDVELVAFGALVGAVRPIGDLSRPGVVDLCAWIAEAVPVELVGSPFPEPGPRIISGAGS